MGDRWRCAQAATTAAMDFWGFWMMEVILIPVMGAVAGVFLPDGTGNDVRTIVGAVAAVGTALALVGAVFLVSLIIAPCRERSLASLGIEDVGDLSASEVLMVVLEKLAALEGRLELVAPRDGLITGEASLTFPALAVQGSGYVSPRIIEFDFGGGVHAAVAVSDGVMENLIVRTDHGLGGPATVRLVVNGEPSSNLQLSITGAGVAEDLTGTESVARGDEIRGELVTGDRVVVSDPVLV